jgi:hypothetical protein
MRKKRERFEGIGNRDKIQTDNSGSAGKSEFGAFEGIG